MSNPACASGATRAPPIPAHIDTLPVEVFQKILIMALPPTYCVSPADRDILMLSGRFEGSHKETFNLPIRVSQVSRQWRKRALSHGQLWSYLCIDFAPSECQWALKAFRTFLERTNGAPLNFGFCSDLRGVTSALAHQTGASIVQILLKEQRRWMDVRFKWTYLDLPADFPEIEITNTPILKSLYLETYLSARNKGQCWAKVYNIPRQIRRLVLRGRSIPVTHAKQLPDLRSCTFYFHYEHPDSPVVPTCLNFLKAAPNLRDFTCNSGFESVFGMFTDDDEEPTPELDNTVVEHNLESIDLEALNNSAAVVDRLRLPALKSLVFEDASGNAAQTLLGLIRRSDPPLTSLELRSWRIDEAALLDLLLSLPTLEQFYLSNSAVSERFFQALDVKDGASLPRLTVDEDRTGICPRLKSLRLQWLRARDPEACADALLSVIQSRHAHGSFQNISLGYEVIPLPLEESHRERVRNEVKNKGSIFIRGGD